MAVWIGLLRAVNVGGRALPMPVLSGVVAGLGGKDVRTYLQSGNVVFSASRQVASSLSGALSNAAGFDVPVLLRSAAELAAVVADQPLDGPVSAWHVTFLESRPAAAAVAALDPSAYGGDSFLVRGREVYLRTPGGYGRTKLTNAFFERKLGVVATTRNWRTVCALAEMSGGDSR
ncbi:MAG: hypothetical protein QOD07_716 [Frankiaceae bacterium]|jgi:uncharacterized protein (DUF1697 family)|nr:hypothetical protein [Frankiaceae bacterium]